MTISILVKVPLHLTTPYTISLFCLSKNTTSVGLGDLPIFLYHS